MLHPEIARSLAQDRIKEMHRAADAARLAAASRHDRADDSAQSARPKASVVSRRLRLLGARLLVSLR